MTSSLKSKILQVLFWICVFSIYFSSELILRVYYIYGEGNSKEQMEALANKLPGFLKDSLVARQRIDDAQEALEEAKKGKDKNKIIEAYYNYSNEIDEGPRYELYLEMLEQYPKDIKSSRAFLFIIDEDDEKYNLETFLEFIKGFSKKDQTKFITQVWGKVKKFSNERKIKFINHVIKEQYVSGEMFSIFNDMMSIRFKLKMPVSVDKQLEDLKTKSFEMYKRMQKELMKNRDKKK